MDQHQDDVEVLARRSCAPAQGKVWRGGDPGVTRDASLRIVEATTILLPEITKKMVGCQGRKTPILACTTTLQLSSEERGRAYTISAKDVKP